MLIQVLMINVATFAMMVGGSLVSGSSSLLSGTLDNFGDALTYAFSLAVVGSGSVAKARVALLKGLLISAAAIGVAVQIGWRLLHPEVPLFEAMRLLEARRPTDRERHLERRTQPAPYLWRAAQKRGHSPRNSQSATRSCQRRQMT